MAMLGDPPVLLLDEPTSGLDPNQVVDVRRLIRDLSGEKTVLLSTHILSEVDQICNHVLIIHEGLLVASGSTEDLERRFRPKRRLRLRAAVDRAVLDGVDAVSGVEAGDGGVWLLTVSDAEAAAPRVARAVLEAGGDLFELGPEKSDLEGIFRAVTGDG
jgi:ABC-2 type transport system ATP-binding protein